jgi:hypothetical protein
MLVNREGAREAEENVSISSAEAVKGSGAIQQAFVERRSLPRFDSGCTVPPNRYASFSPWLRSASLENPDHREEDVPCVDPRYSCASWF